MAKELSVTIKINADGTARIDKAKTSFSKLDKGTKTLDMSMKSLVVTMGAMFAAYRTLSQGFAAVQSSIDLGAEFANISTLGDFTAESIANIRQETMDLALEVRKSPTELAKGYYQAVSAGAAHGSEALDLLRQSSILANAGIADVATSVDVVTNIMNAYGKENISAARSADLLFQVVRDGKTTLAEFAPQTGKVAATAAGLGVAFEQVAAAAAQLTRTMPTAQAVTALAGTFRGLTNASKDFKKAGVDIFAVLRGPRGLVGALDELMKITGGNIEEIKKMIPEQEAFNGVLGLTGKNAKSLNKILDNMAKSHGVAAEAAKKQSEGLAAFQESIKVTAEVLLIKIGEIFTKNNALGRSVEDTANNFRDMVKTLTITTRHIENLSEAVRVLLSIFGGWLVVKLATVAIAAYSAGMMVAISATQLYIVPAAAAAFAILKIRDAYKDLDANLRSATESQKAFFNVAQMPTLQIAANAVTQMRALKENKISTIEQTAEYMKLARQVKSLTGLNVGLGSSLEELIELQTAIADKMLDPWTAVADGVKAVTEEVFEQTKSVGLLGKAWSDMLARPPRVVQEFKVASWPISDDTQVWGGPGQMGAPSVLSPVQQDTQLSAQAAPLEEQEKELAKLNNQWTQYLALREKEIKARHEIEGMRSTIAPGVKEFDAWLTKIEQVEAGWSSFASTVANQMGSLVAQPITMFADSLGAVIRDAEKMEDVFIAMGNSIIDMLTAMIVKATAFAAINLLTGGALGAATKADEGGFLAGIGSALGFADGGRVPGDYIGQPRLAIVHAGEEVRSVSQVNSGTVMRRQNNQATTINVTVNATALDPKSVNWNDLAQKRIMPAIRNSLRNGARL